MPLGIWAAVKKDSWVDRACSLIAFVGLSVPDILLSLLALWFAAATGWFPVGGAQSALYDLLSPLQQFWDRAHSSHSARAGARRQQSRGIMRQMRSNLLDTLRAEYVTAARARGLGEGWVIYKHALRNAINPLLTIFGYSLGGPVERRVHRGKHHGLAGTGTADHGGVFRQGFLSGRGHAWSWRRRCW